MKALIFGATGNCGTYCARKFLDAGWTVVGVGRSEAKICNDQFTFVRGDIRDDALYSDLPTDVDLVVNFAGVQPSILSTSEKTDFASTMDQYVGVNIAGVLKILEFVRQSDIKSYVYTTSHRDYENYWSNDHFLENDLPPSINYKGDHVMYAITKTSAKMMGDYYGEAFDIRTFNLRLPMIFLVPDAPYYLHHGEMTTMPFLQVIRNALDGKPLEIWGDPEMVRDYVHVDNLFSLIIRCFDSQLERGTFNVGTGEAVTTERFIKTIGATFAPDPEAIDYIYRPEKRTYKCAIYNVEEQKQLLGYEPVLLEDMLKCLKKTLVDGKYLEKWGWV
ncbi:NAD-dependent epimerase/dehydratase family protein [Roseibium polysiphoniae]|uniref:NAD(P)-dependent oxidoreductase n=1 Tax=Roseibium polysiphoniae TaxID=2571221 RepID=A0ABR9CAN0_9HYPH|nr:NAD(P)-dependent oxidoreductase [Roseibium polysiphoniae]MBD8876658.1 NAD(P)-dependent oxidoreductase [Roseibium polysiphoniae]